MRSIFSATGSVIAATLALTACQAHTPGGTPSPTQTPTHTLHPISVRQVNKSAPAPAGSYECQQTAPAPAPNDPLVACDPSHTQAYTLGPEVAVLHPTHAESRQNVAGYGVLVALDEPSQAAFSSYTSAHVGAQTAFVLNGAVIGAPEIRTPVNSPQVEMTTAGETAQQADAIVAALGH
jgi:preprotein translocase subunit SecD